MVSIDFSKLHLIIIFWIFSIHGINGNSEQPGGPLTRDENQRRLANCGADEIVSPAINAGGEVVDSENTKDWIYGVRTTYEEGNEFVTGTFISPRHMLTSSQIVTRDNGKWMRTDGGVDGAECDSKVDVNVPMDAFNNVSMPGEISNAWILDFCNPQTKKFAGNISLKLMVVEFKENFDYSVPCLVDDFTQLSNDTILDSYGYGWEYLKPGDIGHAYNMYHRKLKLLGASSNLWLTENYALKHDFGSSLLMMNYEKTTLLGVGVKGAPIEGDPLQTSFFNLLHYRHKLCLYTGVCSKEPGALTEKEDQERARSCGITEDNLTLTNNQTVPNWYLQVSRNNLAVPAFMITTRHLIISSELVLGDGNWSLDEIEIAADCEEGRALYYDVPKSQLVDVAVSCFSEGNKCSGMKPVRAYILLICKKSNAKFYHPMIVEVNETYTGSTPCFTFPDQDEQLHNYDTLSQELTYNKVQSDSAFMIPPIMAVDIKSEQKGTGGALVRVWNGRTILMGVGGSNSQTKKAGKTFYSMAVLREIALCDLIGVCQTTSWNPILRPTTESSNPEETHAETKQNPNEVDDNFRLSRDDWKSSAQRVELGILVLVLIFG